MRRPSDAPHPRLEEVRALLKEHESLATVGRVLGISRQRVDQILYIDQQRARETITRQLATGKITRPASCSRCNETGKIHAHHPDYADRTRIEWVCSACHAIVHPHHNGSRHPRPKAKSGRMAIQLVRQLECKKCGHQWYPRHPWPPKVCPVCKRKDWQ